jgi:hypothetical protein
MPRALFCRKAAGYLAILLFALFANCGFLMAQNGARSVDSKLVLYNGLDCFYNNDFVCAKAKFYEYMKLEPSDSVGNARAVLNYYFCLRQEQKVDAPKIVDEDFRAEVFRLIKEGYDKAESQKKGKSGKDLGFYLAVQSELDSVKGLFEYGNGLPGAKESFKRAVDEAVESSRLGSAYGTYLLGLMHYKVGGRVFYERWALDIIAGLRFQKKKGIEMIFSAQPNFPKEFAADVLGSIFQIIALENRKDIEKYLTPEILKSLHEFTVEYPKNSNLRKYSFPQ